ncbi:MAG: ImmA/IrrE family metallo-endopeptidase [Acidobacteriota bacterium]|nr:ImmA/IrrE family metallo-endopeptidase [Acidobacteriota bacterium]
MTSGLGLRADGPLSYPQIERLAARLRETLQFAATQLLPGLRLFESLNRHHVVIENRRYDLNYAVDGLMVEAQAEFEPETLEFVVKLREDTYRLLELDDPRSRFSLAHEIGHIVLHAVQLMRLSSIPHSMTPALYRGKADHPIYRDTEWQANAFGAALLMPAAGIREIATRKPLTTGVLRNAFGVSHTAATKRLEVYGRKKDELI